MKPRTYPPRLRESEEFGAALRALDGEALPPERLARVEQRIAALAAPAGGAGAGAGGAGAGAGAASAGATAAVLKIGVPVIVAIVAAGSYLATRPSRPAMMKASVRTELALPTAPIAPAAAALRADLGTPAPDAGAPATASAQVSAPPLPARPTGVAPRARRPAGETPSAEPADAPPAPPGQASPPAPPASPAPPPSQLPEQIRLFAAAKEAARAGQHQRALALIRELLGRFPKSPLAAEARLSQAEFLLRAGQLAKASAAVRQLLSDPEHAGRRGELSRVLGDLLRKQGDCAGALGAYRQALAGSLSEAEARAARAGIAACASR